MELIWPGSEPSPSTGRTYCFELKSVIAVPNARKIMLNQYVHELKHCTKVSNGEIFISLWDLARIFAPHLSLENGDTLVTREGTICFRTGKLEVEISSGEIPLERAPMEESGTLFIPFSEVMEKVFSQYVYRMGKYIGACRSETDRKLVFDGPKAQPFTARRVEFRMGKSYGDQYFTLWLPKLSRLNVYRMYVPFSYDGSKPCKLAVVLHGGNGNSDTPFQRSGQLLQYWAEKFGYILLAPNSLVHGGNYGGLIPPVHMFPEPEIPSDTPNFYTDEERKEFALAEEYMGMVLEKVLSDFNIDRDHMFVLGNSMGSVGTFHLLARWPEYFKAGAPTGTMPLTEYLNTDALKGKPILYMTGTEDANDPADMYRRYLELREKGLDIQFRTIGGGYHPDAWVAELETIFEFFDSLD